MSKREKLQARKRKRNDTIRKRFDSMSRENLKTDYVLQQLGDIYGLADGTIWAIVKRYGHYK